MDDMVYSYENENYFTTPDRNRNRLLHVQDLITSNNYTNDIKITTPFNPNSPQTSNNYGYDELGNLIKDESECIEEIVWTLSGKIAEIKYDLQQCSTKHNLQFRYDAMGNRVLKIEKTGPTQPEWIYTYYTRDAQGNVMAVYNISFNSLGGNVYECTTKLDEKHIYGSSRIGLNKKTNENKHKFSATIDQNNLFDLITNIAVEYPNGPNQAKMFGGSGTIALYHDTAQSYTLELYTEHPIKISSTAMAGFSITEGNGTWITTDTFLTDAAQKITIEALDTLYLFSTFEEMFGYMEYSSAKTTKLKGGSISMGGPLLPIFVKNYSKTAGEKAYELVSHLGNVHMVISDRKVSVEDGSSGNVAYFVSDVISTNDVYPFGSLMPQRSFSSGDYRYGFNTQESVDEIKGVKNHYTAPFWEYDPRVVMRWNTDPVTKPDRSPYEINSNNPITNDDPNGDCDNCETQVSGQVSATFTFGTRVQSNFSLSAGIGGSVRSGNAQGGLNFSLNLYSGGLGTNQGSTGQSGLQRDFVVSPSLTFGTGQASPMATNTFNSMSLSGVTNSFESSGTLASNFVFNSDGRNQRVGSVGGRFGDFSFNVYNDFFPGLGDGGDHFWTGGGTGNINVGGGNTLSFGTEVFTGLRGKDNAGNLLTDPANPANGRYGTYQQTDAQKNLNNGQTFFRLTTSDGLRLGVNFSGRANSGYSQALIHNYLPGIKSPEFDFSRSTPSIQATGGLLLRR